jgi:putative CocE/NonD family hydrolase
MSVEVNAQVEMRDGTILRADIYRPDGNKRHPALFIRGHAKTLGNIYMINPIKANNAGYAVVSQVGRGRGTSGGEYRPQDTFKVEGPDGYDSVEWIARQPWCDGNVGMFGISHLGAFAYLTALENPPHLKAIAVWSTDFNHQFVPANTGGTICLLMALQYLRSRAIDTANRLEKQGRDVNEMRRVLKWVEDNPEEYRNFLPLKDNPLARFENLRQGLKVRLQPASEAELETIRQYEKIMVPCYHESGWYDPVGWNPVIHFNNMRKRGNSPFIRESQHLLMGPWPHGFTEVLGEMNFGEFTSGQNIQLWTTSHLIAFFDKYMLGKDIKIPRVKYFVVGRNQWREAESWPLPETQWQRHYLHSKGSANAIGGNGILNREEPGSELPDKFIYDPQNPVPTAGGGHGEFEGPGGVPGPVEQSRIERRSDVLCYTTPEFTEDIEISGPLQFHLFAATSAVDTDFTAKLVHVYPDGGAYNVVDGIKRAHGRKSPDHPELVNPGEVYEYVITMGNTSHFFPKGHRIRIDISSSNFPQHDRNMNTGNPIGEDARGIPAKQTIYHQKDYASYIDLPVIPIKSG